MPLVSQRKKALDSWLHAVDFRFQVLGYGNLDFGFQSLEGSGFLELYSGSHIPEFPIPESKISLISESRFRLSERLATAPSFLYLSNSTEIQSTKQAIAYTMYLWSFSFRWIFLQKAMKLHAVFFLQNTLLVFGQLQRPWTARDCQKVRKSFTGLAAGFLVIIYVPFAALDLWRPWEMIGGKVEEMRRRSTGEWESGKRPWGTPLCKPYRYMYVPHQSVWFLRRFGLKEGIDFAYFGLESGIVFKGATVV